MAAQIYNITPFDATKDYEITFSYSGGTQAYYNHITIVDDSTSAVVFNDTVQSLQLKHLIPANTLTNGVKYIAQISIYDVDNNLCATTQAIYFLCMATPIFRFTNIVQNQIIKSAGFIAQLEYSQSNGEELQSYSITLYNTSKSPLTTSGVKYDTSDLSYAINGMDDDMQYYIRATGTTINGISIDTGYILFSVDYLLPDKWCLVDLSNRPDIGAIQIRSNIVTLVGQCTVDPIPYLDNTYVDLRDGAKVIFDEGFTLRDTWTVIGSVFDCTDRTDVLVFNDGTNKIKIEYRIDSFDGHGEVAYMQLIQENAIGIYMIHSNYIPVPESTDILSFCIICQNGLFDIKLKNISSV